MSILIRKNQNL